ncbi:MAG: tRNA lysidine(34) synthetase TilS [Spirochaetaceae bacterium]|nr:MAG: tRNA lysidine(34) synthetase TilS [Spirochaetaceae bacterium]
MSSTEEPRGIEEQVLRYLQRFEIGRGSSLLVALSGGPDSLCLLSILHDLQKRYPLSLYVAYLDHGMRSASEAARELEFVRSTCAGMGLELVWDCLPRGVIVQRAGCTGRSVEEVARQARYEFLRTASAQNSCDYIALGHTADDQAETVVMRFFQGIGLGGLPGIPPVRGDLIRPLIDCNRAQILEYLADRGLKYLTDSTNLDRRYLRNAVRHELLPVAERIFPGLRGSVLSLSKRLERLRSYVESESQRRLPWKPLRGGYAIEGRRFLAVPGLLRLFSLKALINTLRAESSRVPYRFLSAVERDDIIANRRVVLSGYGIRLYWRGARLILAADIVGHTEKGYFIEERNAGRVLVPQAGLLFEFDSPVRDGGRYLFRSYRTGDTITLQVGNKRVKKLFAEWRVSECWKIPVVETRAGIVAVLGGVFGYEDRFRCGMSLEQGKALKSMVHRYDVEVE